jgi:hypothetical protein
MLRVVSILAVLGSAAPVHAEDKKVAIRFLGGAKKVPLDELKVTIRSYTGDWTADLKNKVANGKTDKTGATRFSVAPGRYYVDVASDQELPYLQLPVGYREHPDLYDRMIEVGADAEQSFEFNLADACKLILRAVDADTGKGIPGVKFVTENETAELWALAILGDNLGAKRGKAEESQATDDDGNFTR